MDFHLVTFKVFCGCLFSGMLLTNSSRFVSRVPSAVAENRDTITAEEKSSQSPCNQAKSITVNILQKGESWGSGILVDKQGPRYTVLTSAHVLGENSSQIRTFDGQVYQLKY